MALDAFPGTWIGAIPDEGAATDGGPEGEKGSCVGGKVSFSGREEEEGEENNGKEARVHGRKWNQGKGFAWGFLSVYLSNLNITPADISIQFSCMDLVYRDFLLQEKKEPP